MSDAVDMIAALGGENITYFPYGGTARQFKARVERRPTQAESVGDIQYGANTVELWIPRDATNGMPAIQERKDRVRFKKSLDDAQEMDFTVQKVLEEDAGLVAGDGGLFHVLVQS